MATNGTAHEEHPTSSQSSEIGGNKASSGELSKEEVGWYFVEQYYKTLNKSPEKLHVSLSPLPLCLGQQMANRATSSSTARIHNTSWARTPS